MKKKTKKETVIESYNVACENILEELLKDWDLDGYYGYWIGDEIGGIYDHESGFTISMDNMIYCLRNDVSRDVYMKYLDYNTRCIQCNLSTMNLKSYIKGAPRFDESAFEKIENLKRELDKTLQELKEQERKDLCSKY